MGGDRKTNLVLLLPFPFVSACPSGNFRYCGLVHLGAGGGGSEPSPSMQLTQLGCLPPFHCSKFQGCCTYLGRHPCVAKTLPSKLRGRGSLAGERRNISRCINRCLGSHDLPPPLSRGPRSGTPSLSPATPRTLAATPDSQRREMVLSDDGPRPRSCLTRRDPTLHPFACFSFPVHLFKVPTG